MNKLSRKKELLHFFKEICLIPRQTGDEKSISDYLVKFAQDRGLAAEQDAHYNVLIRKPSTIPNYNGPTVIIQGHMDIVYEKAQEITHKYEDGIRVIEENGLLKSADRTTLGADNGLAVAYALDLLDRNDIPLPPLEILITASEEIGLEGVKNLEITNVKGKYLINLDAEEEGVFFTSCAGGVRTDLSLPLEYEPFACDVSITLKLKGLHGGHSGLDIAMGKANSIKLLGRILYHTASLARLSLINSPGKANAIASQGTLRFHTSYAEKGALLKKLSALEQEMNHQFAETESLSFQIDVRDEVREVQVFTEKTVKTIIRALTLLPNGVLNRTLGNAEMVQTSSNIGALAIENDKLIILNSGRSSVKIEKDQLKEYMKILAETLGLEYHFHGDYPQWEYRKNSKLREICSKVYREYSGTEAQFVGIHAGIECGYLSEKLGSDIDMISFGANLHDVHTPRETAEIDSFYRTDEILIEVLKEIGINE